MSADRREAYEKQINRMVKDEKDGHAVIRDMLGVRITKAESKDVPTLHVLMPSYGKPDMVCVKALEVAIAEARKVANVHQPYLYGHSIVHWVRNEMLAVLYQKAEPFTHVLFVDDDIQIEPDSIVRLLSHKKDIVAGLCTVRTDPPIPTMRRFDDATGHVFPVQDWTSGELKAVDGVGTGLMLISKSALDKIGEYYLDCKGEKEMFGDSEKLRHVAWNRAIQHMDATDARWHKNAMWFQNLPATNGRGEYGEDISFCLKAKACGIQVYCDTAVTPLHHGDYGYSVADFLGMKAQLASVQQKVASPKLEKTDYKLSVVIPVFNQLEYTRQCIESLVANTSADTEVVMVDDGSTDDTREYLSDFAGHPRFRVIFNDKNLGVNASWNVGIQAATGDYICVANNDIIFAPGWDKPLIEALQDKNAGIACPFHTYGPEKPADWPKGKARTVNPAGLVILGACFMFRKEFIAENGLVPTVMRHYYGDDWFVWTALRTGKWCKNIPTSYVHHYFAQTTGKIDWQSQLLEDELAFRKWQIEKLQHEAVTA